MASITFDTLKFVKTLEASGISQAQAEAIADAQREAFSELTEISNLATKSDINSLRKEIAEMKFDLLKWILGLSLGQIALVIGILVKISFHS